MSYRVSVAVPAAPTVVTAVFSDIFSTLISTTDAVTGTYGFIQKAMLVTGGMAWQNKRLTGNFNFLKGAQ